MSVRAGVVSFVIKLTDKISKPLKVINANMRKIVPATKKLGVAIKMLGPNTRVVSKDFNKFNDEVAKAVINFNELITRGKLVSSMVETSAGGINNFTNVSKYLANNLFNTGSALNNLISGYKTNITFLTKLKRLLLGTGRLIKRNFWPALKKVWWGLKKIWKYSKMAARALKNIFTSSIDEALKFEWQLRKISNLVEDTRNSDLAMKLLGHDILDMSRNSIFSVEELGDAFYNLAAMGDYTSKQMNYITETVNKLAVGTGSDLSDSMETTMKVVNAFGIDIKDLADGEANLSRVTGIMAAAANRSALEIKDFATALGYVGPIARAMGVSISETSAMLAILSNRGFNASKASTYLREAMSNLASPSRSAQRQLRRLGVSAFDAFGNVRNFADVVNDLRVALSDKSDKDKMKILNEIFGRRSASAMMALMQNEEDAISGVGESIADLSDEFEKGEAILEDQYNKALDTTAYKVMRLKNIFSTLKITIGSAIIDNEGFKKGIDAISNAFSSVYLTDSLSYMGEIFGEFIGKIMQKMGPLLEKLIPILSNLIGELIKATLPLLDSVMPILYAFADVLKELTPYISKFVDALKPLIEKVSDMVVKLLEKLIKKGPDGKSILDKLADAAIKVTEAFAKLVSPTDDQVSALGLVLEAMALLAGVVVWLANVISNARPILNIFAKILIAIGLAVQLLIKLIVALLVILGLNNVKMDDTSEHLSKVEKDIKLVTKALDTLIGMLKVANYLLDRFNIKKQEEDKSGIKGNVKDSHLKPRDPNSDERDYIDDPVAGGDYGGNNNGGDDNYDGNNIGTNNRSSVTIIVNGDVKDSDTVNQIVDRIRSLAL